MRVPYRVTNEIGPDCVVMSPGIGPPVVSLLILHTQTEYGAYSWGSLLPPAFRHHLHIYIVNRHGGSPGFIMSCNRIPVMIAFTAEGPPVHDDQ